MRAALLLFATALAGCATIPRTAAEPPIFHYLRSNRDGSEPEHVVHFRPDQRRIAVYKWVEKCRTAAYVIAWFDRRAGEMTDIFAGKVSRGGSPDQFGRITLAPANRALNLSINTPQGRKTERMMGVGQPWTLFDYDFADLNAAVQIHRPREDFAFWMALAWPDPNTGRILQRLGWVDARHTGIVERRGRAVRQFDLSLRTDRKVRGHLWLEPTHGYIIAADFDRPNHDNYRDFALELERVQSGGTAAWDRMLRAHYGDCPAAR